MQQPPDPKPESARRPFRIPIPFAAFDRTPVDLRILGRTLLHAAIVGAAAGTLGAAFFYGLEVAQRLTLEHLAGYVPLRALGERAEHAGVTKFRPWVLWLIPAIGALAGGVISAWLAPETQGGGGDAMIDAFHRKGGIVRRRVLVVKAIASIFTLGSGGSGGREGPTMHIGASIGSTVGRYLRVDARERRLLLVAGCSAGMSAVFRTPLGAALLAVEVLYRDDFESDALIPALLASVISYSVFVSIYGESTLFAHAAHYPFIPVHLPLYALMSLFVATAAIAFLAALRAVQARVSSPSLPIWLRPALGGLGVGLIATPVIAFLGPRVGQTGQGFGILGGGYGAAQVAIMGAGWLPHGWRAVELLALLGVVKIAVTSLTVGSGGSAGDFGPSLVMTCELAGSYDLLVPLMLAEGIAFVVLRKRSLYHAQVATKRDSPAHAHELITDVLDNKCVSDVLVRDRPFVTFDRRTASARVRDEIGASAWQDVFPVLDPDGTMVGIIDASILRAMVGEQEASTSTIAADLMRSPIFVRPEDGLHDALDIMVTNELREIPVIDEHGKIVGFLDEADVTRVYLAATNAPSDG